MKKGLAISGGSTKISFLAGAAIELMKINDYDIITGISAGSIISLMLGIGEFDLLQTAVYNCTQDDFFDVKPLNDNGDIRIRSLFRLLKGKHSLGDFSLIDLLKKYYTPEMHERMQNSGKSVKVGAVNMNLIQIEYCDITKVDYELALKWVVASSSIPLATDAVKIGDYYYFDGGVLEHVGGMEALMSGAEHLDVVYSRSENLEVTAKDLAWKPKNIFSVVMRTLDVMGTRVSFENESEIDLYCKYMKIPLQNFYAPFTLTENLYKMDTDLSKAWFELGKKQVIKSCGDI
jgi:predicted patatin/cPLA2 family phospholipase